MSLDEEVRALRDRGEAEAAATRAIKALGPEILGYLGALLHDAGEASEVFSQFAEDLWRGLPAFRFESSLRTWAYKLAWHAASRFARDPYRRRRERLETTLASRLAEHLLSSAGRSVERRAAEVGRLRQYLSPEEQTLLVLRVDRRLAWREVAEVLGGEGGDGEPGGGGPPDEVALRKRFERLKEKLARAAREEGLLE